jgi:hypothetical protein
MGESQSLSNFSEGGVAPTELPATTPTAQRRGHRSFQSPPTGRGHPPSLISTHKASMIVTTLTHVQPWLDPEKIEDLWYFDGPPETPDQIARSFAAVPNRIIFVGHYHRWLLATADGVQAWVGDRPIVLDAGHRYLVAIHAVCDGWCALFDSGTNELVPFTVELSAHVVQVVLLVVYSHVLPGGYWGDHLIPIVASRS